MKNGQIAHINRNRNDNQESNLAFLCFDHHDNYDSTRSQSKGITPNELVHAKSSLYEELSQKLKPEQIKISISIDRDFYKLTLSELELLLKNVLVASGVQGAYDIKNISPGSIKFTVQLGSDDAEKILSALAQQKLNNLSVLAVSLASPSREGISFSRSFKVLHHGVSKRQAIDVMFHPDSALHLRGNHQVGIDEALFSLYLKQITPRYSILLLVVKGKEIDYAIPISHSDVHFDRGANPLQVLREFLIKYGMELAFDGRRSFLWISERIDIPFNVRTHGDFIRYLEQRLQEREEEFELCCCIAEESVISRTANVQIMFAVSKDRYYPSLRKLGLNLNQRKLGRFMSRR